MRKILRLGHGAGIESGWGGDCRAGKKKNLKILNLVTDTWGRRICTSGEISHLIRD